MRIEEIDHNFVAASLDGMTLHFRPADCRPFAIAGLPFLEREHEFCRLPQAALPAQNPGVQNLAWCTAGAQLRFRTDATHIAVKARLRHPGGMSHMPLTGQSGFDLYVGSGSAKRFYRTVRPPQPQEQDYEALFQATPALLSTRETREVTLNFPLYNGVCALAVGLNPEALLLPPAPFTLPRPLLFYGSSITQGGCASRPGNAYPQILGRRFDAEVINYGFSGSARGELAMADIIAGLELAALIMDYDHNAPTPEWLQETHEPFFRHIRERRPELPVVMVSKPDVETDPEKARLRRAIIMRTYLQALEQGDRRVHFVDGHTLFGQHDRDACTVDGCHPNDLGFLRMADTIEPVLRSALTAD